MTFRFETFSPRGGVTLAYRKVEARDDSLPGVVFCGGFMSDMSGTKASFLEERCRERGQAYLRFDYTGHGQSSGKFTDGTIGSWTQDALDTIDRMTSGPQIVIGSSMGGWIALLVALKRPDRAAGVIGIAAAPDFTDETYHTTFTDENRAELAEKGVTYVPSDYGDPYPFSRTLIEEARDHFLLSGPIDITCPVRLIYSKTDDVVPWEKAEAIRTALASDDVAIHYIPDGDHRISRPQDLALIDETINELNAKIALNSAAASSGAGLS